MVKHLTASGQPGDAVIVILNIRVLANTTVRFFRKATVLLLAPAGLLAADALPSAGEIIDKALARAKWQKEQAGEGELRFRYRNRRTKFDSNGKPAKTEERVYRVYPLDGGQYYELIEVDGQPPDEKERAKERKEREKFRKQRAKAARGEPADEEDEYDGLGFNKEMVQRYESRVEGVTDINGRRTYVLRFEPRSGDLPVRKRIDHALNNSAGRLWIDAEEYGVARVEFELLRPVKFWGGLIGALRDVEGRIEFTRLPSGMWHPKHMEFQMEGRVVWNSLNQKMVMDWTDFQAVDAIAEAGAP